MVDQQTTDEAEPVPKGLRATFRAFLDLVGPGERSAWVVLLLLAIFTAGVEMLGAALVFAIAGMFASDVAPSTLPIVGRLVERLGGGETDREVLIVAGFVTIFYVFRGVVVLGQTYYQAKVAHETGRRLGVRLFHGYLSMPYPFHLERNTAELIRTAFNSVRLVITNFLRPMLHVVSDNLVALGLIVVLVIAAPWATALAAVVLVPTIYIMLRWVRPKLHRLGVQGEAETAESLRTLQHSLQGIREIKVTQTADFFAALFDRSSSQLARVQYRFAVLSQAPQIVVETLVVLLIVILLVVTSIGPLAGGETLAILGLFAYTALRLMPVVNRSTNNINRIRFGSAAVDSVRQDLDLIKTSSPAPPTETPAFTFQSAIELRDVGFSYGQSRQPALRNIDLVIKPGDTLGIVGPTGAGKSTVLDLILSLLSPTSGELIVDGEPIESRLPEWLSSVGMVPQTLFLLDDTIRRNVAFGLGQDSIDDRRVAHALELTQLADFVESLPDGVETVVGERGVRLSGGQRQRIAIARALYGDPSILILDEGTSALDTATEAELMKALEQVSRNRTVILVAHRLSTVRNADRIVFLDEGRVVDIGSYDELVARNARFRSLAQ